MTINISITGTMTQNGLDNLMVKTASAETESVTITATVTLDEVSLTITATVTLDEVSFT